MHNSDQTNATRIAKYIQLIKATIRTKMLQINFLDLTLIKSIVLLICPFSVEKLDQLK